MITVLRFYVCCLLALLTNRISSSILVDQMIMLDDVTGKHQVFPRILEDPIKRPRAFATPKKELYGLWREIQEQTDIPFDMLYAPRTFEILMESDSIWKDPGINIRYYCCGGESGNESQLDRYRHLRWL